MPRASCDREEPVSDSEIEVLVTVPSVQRTLGRMCPFFQKRHDEKIQGAPYWYDLFLDSDPLKEGFNILQKNKIVFRQTTRDTHQLIAGFCKGQELICRKILK